jgi:hypothetical protein
MINAIRRAIGSVAFATLLLWAAHASAQADKGQPIRIDPDNPRIFLYPGNTAVVLITSGEHYGAVLNADFDYRRYLAALQADGLNYTRLFGGSYVEIPGKSFGILRNDLAPLAGRLIAPWVRSNTAGYAGGGNKFDLERWDPEYFGRFHDFLSQAAKRRIVVEVTLFSSSYDENQWQVSAWNPANNVNGTKAVEWKKVNTLENGNILGYQERYARKLVREANGFDNVIFEIQNEPWADQPAPADVVNPYLRPPGRDAYPNSVELANEVSLAWQARVAEWISKEEASFPNRHLIAQNYCNFRLPVRKLLPGVDIVNFHYAYPEAVSQNYGLGKPISYDETGFLGRDDDGYLRQAWNFMLSGGSVFDGLDYSFTAGHEDGRDLEPNGPGGGSPTLRRELGILSQFMRSLTLANLRPDLSSVRHAAGVVARVLSNPGKQYAIYLDGNGPTVLTLDLPGGNYTGEWLDVRTGIHVKSEKFEHRGGEKDLESPDFSKGVALRLDRVAPLKGEACRMGFRLE